MILAKANKIEQLKKSYQEWLENTFGVSVNMFINDYDTDEPISYKDIEILNPENVSDESKVDVFLKYLIMIGIMLQKKKV